MKDYGNDPDWFTDAGGNRYHRKATARRLPNQEQPERHWLYGPGIGHKRTDKFFDGMITALVVAVCGTVAWAMLGTLKAPEPAIKQERSTIECGR